MSLDVSKNILVKKLSLLISFDTFKSLSTIMAGTFISAFVPLIFAPIISRIYAPEFYGILGVYMAISGLVGVLAYSHYPQAIMITKDIDDAKQVIWFCFFLSTAISLFSGIIILILGVTTNLIKSSPSGWWLALLPLSVFFNGITATLSVWANRVKEYKNLASNRVIQAVLTVIIQIYFGLLYKNEKGLMIGFLFGQFVSAFLLFLKFYFRKNNTRHIGKPVFADFRKIASEHKKFFIYVTPTEFINNFINQTPIFLLQILAGPSYVGSFVFTQRFLGLPQQYLSNGIVDIFKQKASDAYIKNGNCQSLFTRTFKLLLTLAVVPLLVVLFFGPQIFTLLFGHKWTQAGVFSQYLSILFFLRFIISPLTYVYYIVGKLKEDFILHLLFLILTTTAFYVTDMIFANKEFLILAYSLSYSSIYIIYFIRSYKFSINKIP